MTGRRLALVIANGDYENASLQRLQSAASDAEALVEVLSDPAVAGFEVQVLADAPAHEVMAAVEDRLTDVRPDDLVVLHFSGHGLKDESGALYLAARNTRPDRLGSTAVPAEFLQRTMNACRARRLVLFLDCCYGGAFGRGIRVRASGSVNVMDAFPAERVGGGRGRAVISAASSVEFAFEGDRLTGDKQPPSVFTHAVVTGLRTGDADLDGDGLITLDELYDYVFDAVRARNPRQSPTRRVELEGDLVLASSVQGPRPVNAPLRQASPSEPARASSRERWTSGELAVAIAVVLVLGTVLFLTSIGLVARYDLAMPDGAPQLVPLTVGAAVVAGWGGVAMVGAARRGRVTSLALGLAIAAGAAAIQLACRIAALMIFGAGFVQTGMVVELVACAFSLVGCVLGVRLGRRAAGLSVQWSRLRTGAGGSVIAAATVGGIGALMIFESARSWDGHGWIWSLLPTVALVVLVPLLTVALHPGGDGLLAGWVITLLAAAATAYVVLDPSNRWEPAHEYGVFQHTLYALGIALLAGSTVILVLDFGVRSWRSGLSRGRLARSGPSR